MTPSDRRRMEAFILYLQGVLGSEALDDGQLPGVQPPNTTVVPLFMLGEDSELDDGLVGAVDEMRQHQALPPLEGVDWDDPFATDRRAEDRSRAIFEPPHI
jgi:hypothetical protein